MEVTVLGQIQASKLMRIWSSLRILILCLYRTWASVKWKCEAGFPARNTRQTSVHTGEPHGAEPRQTSVHTGVPRGAEPRQTSEHTGESRGAEPRQTWVHTGESRGTKPRQTSVHTGESHSVKPRTWKVPLCPVILQWWQFVSNPSCSLPIPLIFCDDKINRRWPSGHQPQS